MLKGLLLLGLAIAGGIGYANFDWSSVDFHNLGAVENSVRK